MEAKTGAISLLENVVLGWREPRRRRGRWAKPSLRGCESGPRTV